MINVNPWPKKENPHAKSVNNRPGGTIVHHAPWYNAEVFIAKNIIIPQLIFVGSEAPIRANPASAKIAETTLATTLANINPTTFGKR